MFIFLNLFKKKNVETDKQIRTDKTKEKIATRKGEIGEYKIDIQLEQLPKNYRYLSDLLVKNPKAKSGYSQIDHVVITPYGIFVIETKNYQGTIYGGKDRKTWLVNGKFKMMNPFLQNYGHIMALTAFLNEKHYNTFISIVSFTKRCTFKTNMEYREISSNELIIYDIELSEFLHRKISLLKIQHKEPLFDNDEIQEIYEVILSENITDPKVRETHNDRLKIRNPIHDQSSCEVCKKPVSEKVKKYCLTNQKFKGKIYCYEHQKIFNN